MSSNTAQLPWLDAFFIANPDVCYLDGNSLGRLPLAAQKRVDSLLVDGWGKQLIGGWNADWIHLPGRIGAKHPPKWLGLSRQRLLWPTQRAWPYSNSLRLPCGCGPTATAL